MPDDSDYPVYCCPRCESTRITECLHWYGRSVNKDNTINAVVLVEYKCSYCTFSFWVEPAKIG